jgi:hypothetical protein
MGWRSMGAARAETGGPSRGEFPALSANGAGVKERILCAPSKFARNDRDLAAVISARLSGPQENMAFDGWLGDVRDPELAPMLGGPSLTVMCCFPSVHATFWRTVGKCPRSHEGC